MIIDITIMSLKRDMRAIDAVIEYDGFTEEAGDMCIALLDRMTGLLNERISEPLLDFIFSNLNHWYDVTKLVLAIAHADDPDYKMPQIFGDE